MIVFLKAQLVPVLSDSESEKGGEGVLVAGTSSKWTESHKEAVKMEINKDES